MGTYRVYVARVPEILPVSRRRLGRHVEHDERSRDYAFAAVKAGAVASVRHQRFIPVLDQGDLGSCCGEAAEGLAGTGAVYQALPEGLRPSATDEAADQLAAVGLYSAATRLDGVPGAYPPDDTGSSGLGAAKAMKAAGLIAGYQHTFTLSAALAALSVAAVMTGAGWYDSFDAPDSRGRVKITPGASVRGGHEFVVDEIVADEQLVGATNSWGAGFGARGRFYFSFADWERLLGEQGDVTVPVPLSAPAPVPSPQPVTPDAVDEAMWKAVRGWAGARHAGCNRKAAQAVSVWAAAKDLG